MYHIFNAKQAEWVPLSILADEFHVNGDAENRSRYLPRAMSASTTSPWKLVITSRYERILEVPQKMGILKYFEEGDLVKNFI